MHRNRSPTILAVSLAAWASLALFVTGCASHLYDAHPCERTDLNGCLVEDVRVAGNRGVGSGDIEDRIATAEDHRALGGILKNVPVLSALDRLTVDYERLDPLVLDRDLARVERYYHARGYYDAHVRAGRVSRLSGEAVRVEIVVDEGTPVRVAERPKEWKDWLQWPDRPIAVTEAGAMTTAVDNVLMNALKPGSILLEDEFESTKRLLLRAMTDHGFPYAHVVGKVDVDLVKHLAAVSFQLENGPYARFGEVKMVGNGALPAKPMLAALAMKQGHEFSTAALEAAEVTLADFGVFGSIQAIPDLAAPGKPRSPVVPVTIRVQPAAMRAIHVGVGAEVGGIVEAHGVVGWEDHNLFGGLRRFSVEARPGVVFYPKTFDTLFSSGPALAALPELRLRFDFRQPALFGAANLTWILRGAYNHYRLPTADPLDDVGYNEIAGTTGFERAFLKAGVYLGMFMNLQYDAPFAYVHPEPPVGYQKLTIPYAQIIATLDRRYGENGKINKIDPHKGFYLSADLQGAFGDARDVRLRPEFRAYAPVSKKLTLAFRLSAGFLFPFNYPTYTDTLPCDIALVPGGANAATVLQCDRDRQLLQFRGFFSGGANSNRGYAYNGVGPREATLTPATTTTPATLTVLGTGGLTLWESSLELRIPLVDKLGSSLFVDASDVRYGEGSFSLLSPHLAAGFGVHYQTPIGPLRGDFGVRVPCAQTFLPGMPRGVANCPEDASAAAANQTSPVFGLPLAVSIAIGEAF